MNLITRLHQCSLHLISLAAAKLHFINMWNYSVPDVCDFIRFYGDPRCMNRKPEHIQQDICVVHLEEGTEPFYASSMLNDDPV